MSPSSSHGLPDPPLPNKLPAGRPPPALPSHGGSRGRAAPPLAGHGSLRLPRASQRVSPPCAPPPRAAPDAAPRALSRPIPPPRRRHHLRPRPGKAASPRPLPSAPRGRRGSAGEPGVGQAAAARLRRPRPLLLYHPSGGSARAGPWLRRAGGAAAASSASSRGVGAGTATPGGPGERRELPAWASASSASS